MSTIDLGILDIDGLIANSEKRFAKASETKIAIFQQHIAESDPEQVKAILKQAEEAYWQTAFTPELISLDTIIPGAVEAVETLQRRFDNTMLLTSRIEPMRDATMEWLDQVGLWPDNKLGVDWLIMKPTAYKHIKSAVWKAVEIQKLAVMFGARTILFVDDEASNLAELEKASELFDKLLLATSLVEALDLSKR